MCVCVCVCAYVNNEFYNSAITKPIVCARIVVEMSSHVTARMLRIKSEWSIQAIAVTGHVKFFRKSKMAAKPHDLHSA